jgi:hypothetical protein
MSIYPWITRRRALQTGAAAALAGIPVARASSETPTDQTDALARKAYIWGYPLVMFGRYRDAYKQQGNPLNQFLVQTALSTPSTPGGGPGTDTLYGYTWIDLRGGPQILHVPDTGQRYYSIQLIDMYSNIFAYVGRRTTGTKAGAFAVVGPRWKGSLPSGVKAIRSPTDDVIAFTRTFVLDDADTEAARDVQSQFAFGDLSDYPRAVRFPVAKEEVPLPPVLDLSRVGIGFYDELCAGMIAAPPPSSDHDTLQGFAQIGIAPGRKPSGSANPDMKKSLEAAIPVADKVIKTAQFGTQVNGWYVNFSIVSFPKDPLLRASSVKYGPGGHVAEEALYFNIDKSPDGQPLTGERSYALRFPGGGLPPVDAFWSLTLYDAAMHLAENPIQRYAIKDRTPGLVYGADRSLEIQIQHAPPAPGNANWLPTPSGPFRLVLRTYQPRRELLTQAYRLPPLVLVS